MSPIPVYLLTAALAIGAVAVHSVRGSLRAALRYFTVLSNLYCAAGCLAAAVFRMAGELPAAVTALRFSGTVAVTVTLLTVVFFLMPQYGFKALFTGPDLWLHLVCPLLAIAAWFAWDRAALPFPCVLLGLLPVALYGLMYLKRVVLTPAGRGWDDFYGFNRGGRWKLSMAVMMIATLALSTALWAL